MSNKFTPGPWVISHGGLEGDDGFSVASNNSQAERIKVVCECWPCTIVDNEHRHELRANANLIAAAPELLHCLSQIIEDLPWNRDWLDPSIECCAKATIAKATGAV